MDKMTPLKNWYPKYSAKCYHHNKDAILRFRIPLLGIIRGINGAEVVHFGRNTLIAAEKKDKTRDNFDASF
jgi:hypothetical protein